MDDATELGEVVATVIDDNPKAVADYHAGEGGALNYLVGQVMQRTGGSMDPDTVSTMLVEEL